MKTYIALTSNSDILKVPYHKVMKQQERAARTYQKAEISRQPAPASVVERDVAPELIIRGLQQKIEHLAVENLQLTELLMIFRAIFESILDPVIVIDEHSIMQFVNPATSRVFGYPVEEMLGQDVKLIMPSPDREHHQQYVQSYLTNQTPKVIGRGRELIAKHKDGHLFPVYCGLSEIRLEKERRYFSGILHDLTEQKELEQQHLFLATHDALTGLLNRSALFEKIQEDISRESRKERSEKKKVGNLAVIFLDLNKFKEINDTYGHLIGDQAIQAVAQKLQLCIRRQQDRIGRLAGDEFIIEVAYDKKTDLNTLLKQLVQEFQAPTHMQHGNKLLTISVSASFGVALFPAHGSSAGELVQKADAAMYEAKANGINSIRCYTGDVVSIERKKQ